MYVFGLLNYFHFFTDLKRFKMSAFVLIFIRTYTHFSTCMDTREKEEALEGKWMLGLNTVAALIRK